LKTGMVIGAITAVAVNAGIQRLRKEGVDRPETPDL
jgi:hypothetical protein